MNECMLDCLVLFVEGFKGKSLTVVFSDCYL